MAVDIVSECKARLGITGDYHDATLAAYAEDVKAFLLDAGVPAEVVSGDDAVGCIARGVADLWNYGAGEATLSQAFFQRAIQLAAGRGHDNQGPRPHRLLGSGVGRLFQSL